MSIMSEAHLLALLSEYFPTQHSSLLMGRGDDAAVVRWRGALSVSTDLFLEDVHFRRRYFHPEEIGHKALAVNISDMAAMGVRPLGFTLGLALPAQTDEDWLRRFFSGMSALASEHRMVLAGGDISQSPSLHICVTIWGEGSNIRKQLHPTHDTNEDDAQRKYSGYLTRGGAMPGDTLFLVGSVGLARMGLEVLEKHGHAAREQWPCACAAHLRPQPQVDAGLIVARSALNVRPPVLMDVSDGLARDLPRLLGCSDHCHCAGASDVLGAQVILPEAFLEKEFITYQRQQGRCPVHEAWVGGEDYALLGACLPKLFPLIRAALPNLRSIGTVTDAGGILLNGEAAPLRDAFDHFSSGV